MMVSSVAMIVTLAALFAAAILNLAVDSVFRRQLTRYALIAAMVIGSVFYGHGYAWCHGFNAASLIRALMALSRMFAGINDLGSVQNAPLFQYPAAMAVFWLGHFLGFYVMASAAIATLGEKLLRTIRVTLLRRGTLLLVFGVNAHSVAYGRRMAREKHRSVVFVDQAYNPSFEDAVKAFGAVIEKSAEALEPNARFLRQLNIRPGERKMELAALHEDSRSNLEYARTLLAALTEAGIRPEQTSLLAMGSGDEVSLLQAMGGEGYGSVYAFDDYELTARLMFREHPPCDLISFDAHGKAENDFHAVILGFGRLGRAVLNQLVMNGQFYGSRFRVDIFDPGAQNGFLHDHPMMAAYDIRFHGIDGTADAFYSFLSENRGGISLIVLCTGNQEKNHEIAGDLAAWMPWNETLPLILHASRDGYFWLDENRHEVKNAHFLDSESMDLEEMDAVAMQVNYAYCRERGTDRSAFREWQRCDYFSRQSCRACADYYPAVMRAAGRTPEQVLSGKWPPDEETLENLSATEHLRWCAFHYVSGYAPMPAEEWEKRAEAFRQGAGPGFRIGKDTRKRLQACLIPWEELDDLSRRENEVTGGHTDYRQMDRNNVLMLSEVLSAQKRQTEGKSRE